MNEMINRVIIESNRGDKSFILIKGNLLRDDGDLIVVNTYEDMNGNIIGDFSQMVKEQFHLANAKERTIFFLENGGSVNLIESSSDTSIRILILHSRLREGEPISKELYEKLIKGLFSALVSLEVSGYRFSTISLPVLLRKGISHIHNEAAAILIQHAVKWLKTSKYTNTIRYYVYEKGDQNKWNDAIEQTLGRSVVNATIDEQVSKLRIYLLALIYSFPKDEAVYQDTLVPLQNALNRELISPEVVAAFGRKLAESLCEKMTGNTKVSFNVNLSTLKKAGNLDPFFLQCLYQIKAYGNTSIHRSNPIYGSDTLTLDDLKILLIILKKILLAYQLQLSPASGEI